jgi:hypothetical protein
MFACVMVRVYIIIIHVYSLICYIAHAPPPRGHTCLHDFHLVEFSHQPVPVQ